MKKTKYSLFLFFLLLVTSCNTTKHVPEGEYLLNKVTLTTDNKTIPKDEIKSYIRQMPNPGIFGIYKMQLGIYNLSGNDTTKWLNRFLKRIGDEPVIYDEQLTKVTENQIDRLFYNRGFMNAEVTSDVVFPKEKIAEVKYKVKANTPYKIKGYSVNISQPELLEIASDTARSLIKPGNLFDSDVLDEERARITARFRNLGYYNFTKENLHYYADSTYNSYEIDLVLEVNNESQLADTVSNNTFRKYTFNRIHFYSETDKSFETIGAAVKLDTLKLGNYEIVYENERNIRPGVLIQSTHTIPGEVYSDREIERTYSSLNSLSAIKYMDINFVEIDDNKLDVYIVLTPNKLQTVSTDVEGTYSAGYWGLGGNINYGHRNIFKGSETLSIRGRAAYEYQGKDQHAYELRGDIGLKYPTFLLPFASSEIKRNIRATTEISGNYSFRRRPKEYTGIITGIGFKYSWSERFWIKHNYDVLNISYVYYPYISPEYRDYLSTSPYFVYNFQNHLIMRMGYNGSYSGFRPLQPMRNYSTYNYGVEAAGNLLYGIDNLFGSKKDAEGAYKIFGIRYAQYVKTDFNISHHQIIDKNNRIVYHAGVGIAIPYGNSNLIPFEKRYFSGGANSVRGWTAYQLGPGTYKSSGRHIDYNTQMGDIRIDLNMELRSKLFWKLDGALFLDAGNVWTIKDYETQPGGLFKFSDFIEQMGVAYGAGLRADFSFFVIRLDLGLKLHNPALTRTERWRMKLTKDDYAFNLAIGYPF
ncbi:MAG: BamA/TamA family outer membrane protein [Porphyromonadaceae bacterium]|nr:BamA/TamA family outer membrane protein [Porphyromonadaceae bacterium]